MGCSYQTQLAVSLEMPPVQVIGIEGEVIVQDVAGVGQHKATTLGETQEDVTAGTQDTQVSSWRHG